MHETLSDKILKALATKPQSTQELANDLEVSLGTVRGIICILRKDKLIEPVPALKRGKPFQLTIAGKAALKEL